MVGISAWSDRCRLWGLTPDEPLVRAADLARADARDAIALEVIASREERQIGRVDGERLAAKAERDRRRRRAGDCESALAVRGCAGDRIVHGLRVGRWRNDEGRTLNE